MDVSEAMDASFTTRLSDLLKGRNVAKLCRDALVSRTYLDAILKGDRRKVSYAVVKRLARELEVPTAYLGEGWQPKEEQVETMEQLHAWEVRILRERERHIRSILAAQQAAMATQPLMSPDQNALADQMEREAEAYEAELAGKKEASGQGDPQAKPSARENTAA